MIFVTVGTHQQPFERLVRALAQLDGASLVVQHGYAEPPSGVAVATAFMPFPEMLRNFDEADTVITHAGVGSILCATNAGHVPIVVPRLKRHGEHVDDHQVQLVRELERAGRVIVVEDVDRLSAALTQVPPRRAPRERGAGPLQEAVQAAMLRATDPKADPRVP
jgi:UDP-N-acetylglucosamine transferase subunit ALG13